MEDYSFSGQGHPCPCNDNVIRTRDSIIEETRFDRNTGFVTISYGIIEHFNILHIDLVTLVVTRDTIIQDKFGRNIPVRDLKKGMVVNAEFSSAMTRSIPPQSRAYRITVVNSNVPTNSILGRVLKIDLRNDFLYTGYANDVLSQMRFVITDSTSILDRDGNHIPLRRIRTGQRVRVEHAYFQTPSIPPQTIAFVVQII
jgi:hypothetical protein